MPIANNAMIAAITGRYNQRNDDQTLTFDNYRYIYRHKINQRLTLIP
jgi:ABC-type phosphate transport system substrate-binding protein